jgi:Tfp pilus assembly protein PilF
MRHRHKLIALVFAMLLDASMSSACFYSPLDLDPDKSRQSSLRSLLFGEYEEKTREKRLAQFRKRLTQLEEEIGARGESPDRLDERAMLLYRLGRAAEAEAIWVRLLASKPDRFTTLCNYGTFCEMTGRFDDATTMITRAAALRPNFRGGAEALHAERVRHLAAMRTSPATDGARFWMPDILPIWLQRGTPPKSFERAAFARKPLHGLVELLRQFPNFGDGWLVLGMLLEHDGNHRYALMAYRKALKYASSQRAVLDDHIALVQAYEDRRGVFTRTGPAFLIMVCALVGGFVMYKVFLIGRDVVADIRRARREAAAVKNDDRNA